MRLIKILLTVILAISITACGAAGNQQGGSTPAEAPKETPTAAPKEAPKEKIKLTVADSMPPGHVFSEDGAKYWMDLVTKYTDGQVEFEYYPSEQLGKVTSMLDLARNKSADVVYLGAAYVSDKMPLIGVGELPGSFENVVQGNKAYWDMLNGILFERELSKIGVRAVFTVVPPPYQISTTKKKVTSLEDLKGLKIRSGGGAQDIAVSLLGASPTKIATPELYEAISRGTVDGGILPLTSWKGYNWQEIIKYSTYNLGMGTSALFYAINEEKYQSLPENVKQAIKKAGDETVLHVSQVLDKQNQDLVEEFKKAGVDMYEMDQDSVDELNKILLSTWDQWAKSLKDKGNADAEDVLAAWREALEKVK